MIALRRLRPRLGDEGGASLVELIMAMALLGVIGSVVMSSLSTASRAGAQIDDQTRGLADLQVVTERLSRDLRAGRGVDPLASPSQLTIWIDSDGDYRREIDESVTWRIRDGNTVDASGNAVEQYDVQRVVGEVASPSQVQTVGESLVSDIAFAYLSDGATVPLPEQADSVRVTMEYDAVVDAYARSNLVTFDVRLRNVQ